MLRTEISHAADCGVDRFAILRNLLPITNEIRIHDFAIQREEIISSIEDINVQLTIIPLSISGSTSNTQNFQDLKQNNQTSRQKNSVDMSYDLNYMKTKSLEKQSLIQKELLEFELSQLNSNEVATVLEAMLEYLMGVELQDLFKIERRYYEIKKEYINERKDFGDLNLEKLLEVDKEIRNISDKILANSVKQIERLNFLNVSKELIPINYKISNIDIVMLGSECTFEPSIFKGLNIRKKLAHHKYKAVNIINDSNLNFKLQLSDDLSENEYQNSVGASIELTVPFYDGGIKRSKRKKFTSEERILDSQIRIERDRFKMSVTSRISTEQVFVESFLSIEDEIGALKLTNSELKTRQDLGQGVFEERLNNNLQILALEQAQLRLTTDFLSGWVRFLGTVDHGLQ